MNLDHPTCFNKAVRLALDMGILHVSVGQKRLAESRLIPALTASLGGTLSLRNFHREILNRAYGLAFVNAKKMGWVAKKVSESPVS